jgi:nucleoside-diphosphate kinase
VQRTLLIVKPDAVSRNHVGDILKVVEDAGLRIIGMKMLRLSTAQAGDFYHVHKGKEFYDKLVAYMSSGDCVVVAVEADDTVRRLRAVCGATDPSIAAEGTIRASFGINVTMNSVHASDSPATAEEELRFFFPELG